MGFFQWLSRSCDQSLPKAREHKPSPDTKLDLELKTTEDRPAQPSSKPVIKAQDKPKYKNCRSRFLSHQPIPVKMFSSQMAALDADVKAIDFAQLGEAQVTEPLHLSTMEFLRTTTLARYTSSARVVDAAQKLESKVFIRDYDSDSLVLADQNIINLWGYVRLRVEGHYRKLNHRSSWQGPLRTVSDGKEYTNCELFDKLEGLRRQYELMEEQLMKMPPGPGRQHRQMTMTAVKREHTRYRRDYKAFFHHDVAPLRL